MNVKNPPNAALIKRVIFGVIVKKNMTLFFLYPRMPQIQLLLGSGGCGGRREGDNAASFSGEKAASYLDVTSLSRHLYFS